MNIRYIPRLTDEETKEYNADEYMPYIRRYRGI
jgi:hypothetical protein